MKEREAEDLIRMIKGSVGGRADSSAEDVYRVSLLPLDATLATQAVLAGRRTWKWFPSWAEFREAYRSQEQLRAPVGEQRAELPGKADFKGTPEWVWVWSWARVERNPREERSFPQQDGFGDPDNRMTMEEYKELLSEWKKLGSPKSRNPLPTALI